MSPTRPEAAPLGPGVAIAPAGGESDIAVARDLFVEYQDFLGFPLCFQGFDDELAGLPGRYAPPHGAILLARDAAGPVAGCVAMRPAEPGIAEMKRLFVRPAYRGHGLGRRLALAILERAVQAGYRSMRLDTVARLEPAIALYRSLGFVETARPDAVTDHAEAPADLRYFEKALPTAMPS